MKSSRGKHVVETFRANRSIYGAPRLTRKLWSRCIEVSVATVGRVMDELGVQGACGRTNTIEDET
ncbi:IS3 family transposase [Ferrithrix thermotolerans]|uniref:IS3 family transposase n=1 Tax=Ferrithrix thermotolerans TaxID=209649 RepID=UPI0009325402|nr:IS3 family transposase [Ferrithrix thermotolerans]